MQPSWPVRSGNFAGWRSAKDLLYSKDGKNVGYFVGNIAYSSNGRYLGEIYEDDPDFREKATNRGVKCLK